MKPTWKKYLLYGSATVVVGLLVFVLIETVRATNTGFETKTLWDWLELLIIPLVLAVGAFYLERSERAVERKAAEDRAKLEREIATDRQEEAALQAYLDLITELLLKEKLQTTKKEEVRDVARLQTLTVLRGLNANRKGMLLRFLRDSSLLDVIELDGADFRKTKLNGADLSRANLSGSNLSGANLRESDLSRANLSEVYLIGSDLYRAHLTGADLRGARLNGADLGDADLSKAEISDEQLATAKSLKGAIMPDGTKHD